MIFKLPIASAVAAGLAIGVPAYAQPRQVGEVVLSGTRLDVVATGEVRRAPDLVLVNAGVMTQAPTASAAIQQNAQAMDRVRAALRRAGIADRDIQTSSINLDAQYSYEDRRAPVFTGYRAANQVTVRFRDVRNAGRILDALVEAGANQISGPMFTIDQPEPLLNQARTEALRVAQARAELYARALGKRVRRVLLVSEAGGIGAPPPLVRTATFDVAEAAPAGTRLEPGEQVLNATLTVSFELE